MEFKSTVWKQTKYLVTACLLIIVTAVACEKVGEETTRVKAPLRNYNITARLDNKQAGTDSQATGILKGTYSEESKIFAYTLEYEKVVPASISINKGAKGTIGVNVLQLPKADSVSIGYKSPVDGVRYLTALQERDLIKGLWYVTISTPDYPAGEIRGLVTLKLK